jgi:hypothetical protein
LSATVFVDIRSHHVGAARGQGQRYRTARPNGGAAYYCHPSVDLHCLVLADALSVAIGDRSWLELAPRACAAAAT